MNARHAQSWTRLLNGSVLILASLIGIAAFLYPFFQPPPETLATIGAAAHTQDASLMFVFLIVLTLGAVMGNMLGSAQGLNAKMIAVLGVLTAANAVLRVVPGPAGFSAMFVLPILAGYCFGPTFGFLLGTLSLAVSALLGAGIGPWLPYQMYAVGWVGLLSALIPKLDRWPRLEIVALSVWGALSGLAFGLIINLWFWPFVFDVRQAQMYWQPGIGVWQTVQRYAVYYAVTSLWWDLGRAAGNVLLIAFFGLSILRLLRRFGQRFQFTMRE